VLCGRDLTKREQGASQGEIRKKKKRESRKAIQSDSRQAESLCSCSQAYRVRAGRDGVLLLFSSRTVRVYKGALSWPLPCFIPPDLHRRTFESRLCGLFISAARPTLPPLVAGPNQFRLLGTTANLNTIPATQQWMVRARNLKSVANLRRVKWFPVPLQKGQETSARLDKALS